MTMLTKLTYCDDGADWPITLPIGENGSTVLYRVRNIRREKTGLHGKLGIFYKGRMLASDTFNLERNDPRRKLVRDALKGLGDDVKTFYGANEMGHDLDILCLQLSQEWEEARVNITAFDPNTVYLPVLQRVKNYILDDGGTVFYGKEDSMKSYIMQIMAVCIAQGINAIWEVVQGPVLFINLERSEASYGRREHMIRQVLGVQGPSGVDYIHARGYTLNHVIKKARRYVKEHPGCVVFLDSISRGADGKLIDDDTANRFVNMMNSLACSWAAIGHSPKHSKDLFGSMHFKAGEDIGVMVAAGKHATSRGLCLSVQKANDILTPPPAYYALDFAPDGSGLIGIRKTIKDEFPDIDDDEQESDLDKVLSYVEAQGDATTTATAKALKMPGSKISRFFTKSGRFKFSRRTGHEVYYAVRDEWDEAVGED